MFELHAFAHQFEDVDLSKQLKKGGKEWVRRTTGMERGRRKSSSIECLFLQEKESRRSTWQKLISLHKLFIRSSFTWSMLPNVRQVISCGILERTVFLCRHRHQRSTYSPIHHQLQMGGTFSSPIMSVSAGYLNPSKERPIIIVDGPIGVGKSTVSRPRFLRNMMSFWFISPAAISSGLSVYNLISNNCYDFITNNYK